MWDVTKSPRKGEESGKSGKSVSEGKIARKEGKCEKGERV
jgi:hypothetical protein